MFQYTKEDLAIIKKYNIQDKVKQANCRFDHKLTMLNMVAMLKRFNFKCIYCHDSLKPKKWQMDHFYSKAMGGKNKVDNICPSCRRCNLMKLDMDGFSFVRRCQKVIDNNILNLFANPV